MESEIYIWGSVVPQLVLLSAEAGLVQYLPISLPRKFEDSNTVDSLPFQMEEIVLMQPGIWYPCLDLNDLHANT